MKRGGSHRILHGGRNVAPANNLRGGGRKTATRRVRRKCRGGYMPEMDWRRPRWQQF